MPTTLYQLLRDGASLVEVPKVSAQVVGSKGEQDLRGLMADRPMAGAAYQGWTYWALDHITQADEFTVCDGTNWVNI